MGVEERTRGESRQTRRGTTHKGKKRPEIEREKKREVGYGMVKKRRDGRLGGVVATRCQARSEGKRRVRPARLLQGWENEIVMMGNAGKGMLVGKGMLPRLSCYRGSGG